MADALVIGISQSGRSPDIVAVLEEARRQGALTIAMTNDPARRWRRRPTTWSTCAPGPSWPRPRPRPTRPSCSRRRCCRRRSTRPRRPRPPTSPACPTLLAAALTAEPHARDLAAGHAERERAVVLGRGYSYATAREWALKLQELALVAAMAYSAADFEHGPLALAEPGLAGAGRAPRAAPSWRPRSRC